MNKNLLLLLTICSWIFSTAQNSLDLTSMQKEEGFINYYWNDDDGKIYLEIQRLDEEILYNTGLSAGVGSNDLGLDRGQLGGTHVVVFTRTGDKIFLKEINLDYRAVSDNPLERRAVREAFAESILWGFKIEQKIDAGYIVDATKFFLRDAHKVGGRLAASKQGNYKVDLSRSAMYLPRTKNFPKNSEFEATLTLTGEPKDRLIRSVTPSAEAVTIRQHHSFIELPDNNYSPRVFDPRSGYSPMVYYDYATPIDESLVKRFIRRHRLEKKDPSAAMSEPVEPIVYYMDAGAPEPVKSALMEGAQWWNQAFEAAGYKDAFIMKVMPADADPMDVRYNLIQWIHRSTRGWSYGSSVTDPRTGEIIKGHVSLGSLRVRQDYLIAQGLYQAFKNAPDKKPLLEMALARLRQLAAHEVGHTLGLAHNFAGSTNGNSSVMDYPHPFIQSNGDQIDLTEAYDVNIGEWDKRTILYGYQDFPADVNEEEALRKILEANNELNLRYISDQDARPQGGANPHGHLWDNGGSIISELERMIEVRQQAIERFGTDNLPNHTPMGDLENVLVPLYLSHRYQTEAVSKLIGGVEYRYAVKGEADVATSMVSPDLQRQAFGALMKTLDPTFLTLPESVISLIPPRPMGYQRGRELFKIRTGLTFDPIGAAEAAANYSLSFLLHPQRLSRVVEQHSRSNNHRSVDALLSATEEMLANNRDESGLRGAIGEVVYALFVQHLLGLATEESVHHQVNGAAHKLINEIRAALTNDTSHHIAIGQMIRQFLEDPEDFKMHRSLDLPDGSPIGCGDHF